MEDLYQVNITVNGVRYAEDVKANTTLLTFLREYLGLTGAKGACQSGECGACSVMVDGRLVNSCLMLAVQADGKSVETIEGLGGRDNPHPIQKAFIEAGAVQCGYCTPGMIMAARALLEKNPDPSEDEIRSAMAGNICRCTGYTQIIEAVKLAARTMDRQNGEGSH